MAKESGVDFASTVFDIAGDRMPRGSWWWWFWLFFIDNPDDPKRPRQLMILWSTKNERSINCNGIDMKLSSLSDRSRMDGAVAAWYYDGRKMHHNLLLDPCVLEVSESRLSTKSSTPTAFDVSGRKSTVSIGDRFSLVAEFDGGDEFLEPEKSYNSFVGSLGYSLLRVNRFRLSGKIDGRQVNGTAYFQRVFVNAPSVGWYWGTFHFPGGEVLKYYNIRALGRSFKKEIKFFDGESLHDIGDIKVRRVDGEYPDFIVSGESRMERVEFTVSAYSHSSWTFKKNAFGIIPNKLVYNEYPARITDIKVTDKGTGKVRTTADFGVGVGNAEHTTGMLL